jgi:hypothetical protein
MFDYEFDNVGSHCYAQSSYDFHLIYLKVQLGLLSNKTCSIVDFNINTT